MRSQSCNTIWFWSQSLYRHNLRSCTREAAWSGIPRLDAEDFTKVRFCF